MNRKTSTGLILGGALIVAAGYGAAATQAATPAAPHGSTMHMGRGMVMGQTVYRASGPVITIRDYTFHAPTHVKKGATVTVTNKDGFTHTVTSNRGLFSVRVPGHSTKSFNAPARSGSFKFHCNIHSTMHGTLNVG